MQSQTDKLYSILKDGKPYRSDRLLELVYGGSHLGICRLSARCFDVRKKYKVEMKCWRDQQVETLYWYQITTNNMPEVSELYDFDEVFRLIMTDYFFDPRFTDIVHNLGKKRKNKLSETEQRDIVYAFNEARKANA